MLLLDLQEIESYLKGDIAEKDISTESKKFLKAVRESQLKNDVKYVEKLTAKIQHQKFQKNVSLSTIAEIDRCKLMSWSKRDCTNTIVFIYLYNRKTTAMTYVDTSDFDFQEKLDEIIDNIDNDNYSQYFKPSHQILVLKKILECVS